MNKIKIGVCFMNIGAKYKDITYWSRQNKISYCKKHDYDFIEDETVYNPDKPIPWTKIPLILKYINDYDYIAWIDADILIMNLNTKIEHFINKYPTDIICGSDWRMTNTGVMIIKSSDFSKNFIKAIETNVYDPKEDKNDRYLNWEQGSFINLCDKNFMNCMSENHICVTIPTEMNSYWYNYFPGHFVLHFAGVRGELLQYLIRDHYPERLDMDSDETYNSRMEWLAGPIRDHFDKKLKHDRENELKHLYSYRVLLDNFRCYDYDINNKMRLGNKYDGGYVIANLDINYDCYISAGVSNEESFTRDLIKKYSFNKNNSFAFDGTIDDYPYSFTNDITFIKKNIGNTDNNQFTDLKFLIEKYNNIFLKMDIQGSEYQWLSSLNENDLKKFSQIVIKFHSLSSDDDLQSKIECLKKINKLFYPIHIHANNHSLVVIKSDFYHVPDVLEVTYIRKDLYNYEKPSFSKEKFPTILDSPNNALNNDIKLNFYPFQPYYFSLTTIPSRLSKLNSVIKSLQNQNIKPTKIFINIPKHYERFDCPGVSPTDIKDMSNVVINFCDNDYGPATKFLPMFSIDYIDDDDPIIIVNDDIIYDPNLSSYLLKDAVRYPDSCITSFGITHSAYMFDNSKWFCDFNSQNIKPCGFREKFEGYVDVFEGFKGALLKKKLFKDDVFVFPNNEYKFSDDIWFSGHIIKNGFTIFISKFKNESKFIQDDVDASDLNVRNKRMYDTAYYFHQTYGIWKIDA